MCGSANRFCREAQTIFVEYMDFARAMDFASKSQDLRGKTSVAKFL